METVTSGGLGSALADQTNLTGNWGSVLTPGVQTQEANEFKRIQIEADRANKEQAKIGRLMKYVNVNPGKWFNPKNQEAYGKIYGQTLSSLIDNKESPYAQAEVRAKHDQAFAELKAKDDQEAAISRSKNPDAKKIYNTKGIDGLIEHDKKYPWAPLLYQNPDTGGIGVNDHVKYDLDKTFGNAIDNLARVVPDLKPAGMMGLNPIYEVDPNSKAYQKGKIEIMNGILSDPAQVDGIISTPKFKAYFDETLAKKTSQPNDLEPEDRMNFAESILPDFLQSEFNRMETTHGKVRVGAAPRKTGSATYIGNGGGVVLKNKTLRPITEGPDTGWHGVYNNNGGDINLKFTGVDDEGKQGDYDIINPVIKYNPNSKTFTVKGKYLRRGRPVDKNIEVNAKNFGGLVGAEDGVLTKIFGYVPDNVKTQTNSKKKRSASDYGL